VERAFKNDKKSHYRHPVINAFGAAGSDAALVISIAYIIQVRSTAWYVKYADRIFK